MAKLSNDQLHIAAARIGIWASDLAKKGMVPVIVFGLEPGEAGKELLGDVIVSDDLSADDVRRLLKTALMNLPDVAGGASPVKN